MTGYLRLGNFNLGMLPDAAPEPGETVLALDRSHPVLGNHRHILRNPNDPTERARVIAAYRADMDADFAAQGPMYWAVRDLARRVKAGEKIVGMCHCAPRACHVEVIIERVEEECARETTDAHNIAAFDVTGLASKIART